MTQNPVAFSVVTPVLNGAPFLPACIACLQAQSVPDYEHIILDAGSHDGSVEIAEAAASDDSRIRVIRHTGQSQYAAIAEGLDLARGRLLSWLNCDDLYAPWTFARLRGHLDHHDDEWLSGLPACWQADGTLAFVRADAWRPRGFIRRGWYHGAFLGFIQQETIFFSRQLYKSLTEEERRRFAQSALAGDFLLWTLFAARTDLRVVPALLGGFRRHGANRSVVNRGDYMAEAETFGAAHPPAWVRRPMTRAIRAISAAKTARLAIDADRDLFGGAVRNDGSL